MIFNWFGPYTKPKLQEPKHMWEWTERPVYNKEHRETMEIIEDILVKLDELNDLIREMKDKENE
jgi:hypothetical protein